MQMGGYPFGKNDLTLEEWGDLGRINEAMTPPAAPCPLLTKRKKD